MFSHHSRCLKERAQQNMKGTRMSIERTLDGKACAGNSPVRFDEGEVALTATPRHGSLLCINKLVLVAVAMVVLWLPAEEYVYSVGVSEPDVVWSSVADAGPTGLMSGDIKNRTLVKTGGGRLVIACDLKSAGFTGEIRVREGFLQLRHDGACGTSAGGVVVENGATLEGDSTYKSSGTLIYSGEPLTFGGFGVNGTEGALKMIGSKTYQFFEDGRKTMTTNTLVNGGGRLDIRGGTFDMGGWTLYGSNTVRIVNASVERPGKIVWLKTASPGFEGSTALNGDSGNEMVFVGCTKFSAGGYSSDQNWTLAISNTVTISPSATAASSINNMSTAVNRNRWSGPIYIGSGATLYVAGLESDGTMRLVNLNGKISGPGALCTTYRKGYLRLTYADNDFTGKVTIGTGTRLEAVCLGSLGRGALSVDGSGVLKFLYSGVDGFIMTETEQERMWARKRSRWSDYATRTWWTGYKSLTDDYFWTDPIYKFEGVPDFTYSKDLSDGLTIYHEETNTLTLAGTITGRPDIVNTCGTLVLAGSGANLPGNIYVRDGTVKIGVGTSFSLGSRVWRLNGRYPATPRLVVGANAVFANIDTQSYALPRNIAGGGLGNAEDIGCVRGIFELEPGSIATNVVIIGGAESATACSSNNMGAAYLRGRLVAAGDSSRDKTSIGMHADGYLEIGTDGVLDATKGSEWICVGCRARGAQAQGHGVMHVKGGRMIHNSSFAVNDGGGYGHVRVSSGVVSNGNLIVGKSLYTNYSGGEGVLTVEGGECASAGTLQIGGISNSVSVVNMNGGVLRPMAIQVITAISQMNGWSSATADCDFRNAGNATYVNFNGGTYKPTIGTQALSWFTQAVTRYTVYAGGACVDNGGYTRTLTAQLKAPTGKGVKSVAFACDEPWRYVGAPYVHIVDPTGTGFGATAAADFDSTSGVVTGVTVASPGCNYGEGTYAEISFGGWTNTVRAAVTLADNDTSGGFTKKGAATLYIASTNEWHGVTRVAEGTLRLSVRDALPNTSGVEVDAGAVFDQGAFSVPAGTLAGSGEIIGDFTLSGTLTVDAADLVARRFLTVRGVLTVLPGAKLVVKNPELLDGETHRLRAIHATGGITGSVELDRESLEGAERNIRQDGNNIYFSNLNGGIIILY